ncbi:SapB/AmfS family lanthipeptide [Streptomyces carpaticus]|uniref:SapB/AmfS family lanthipeptide n=1 Tax=Streptomyces carpaticus TaxID=285558 RepID=A0ABV4ZPA2_9ACTN
MSVLDLQNLETEAEAVEAQESWLSLWNCEEY